MLGWVTPHSLSVIAAKFLEHRNCANLNIKLARNLLLFSLYKSVVSRAVQIVLVHACVTNWIACWEDLKYRFTACLRICVFENRKCIRSSYIYIAWTALDFVLVGEWIHRTLSDSLFMCFTMSTVTSGSSAWVAQWQFYGLCGTIKITCPKGRRHW